MRLSTYCRSYFDFERVVGKRQEENDAEKSVRFVQAQNPTQEKRLTARVLPCVLFEQDPAILRPRGNLNFSFATRCACNTVATHLLLLAFFVNNTHTKCIHAMPGNKQVPACGFAVTPRYPVGTRFRKTFDGHGSFVGSVTSFDGELYEVLYEDGDQEIFDASGFDGVEILPVHKRPSTPKKRAPVEDDNGLTKIPTCPVCLEEFASDPSAAAARLPVQAKECAHVICKVCVGHIKGISGSSKVDCRCASVRHPLTRPLPPRASPCVKW